MKTSACLRSAFLLASSFLWALPTTEAGEDRVYTHHFSVSGVVCSACSKVVKESVSKVDGVLDVKIRKGKDGELPVLTVESNTPTLSQATLQAALGATSGHFQILATDKPPAAAAP